MNGAAHSGARPGDGSRGVRRAVVVADNPLIVAAIRSGVRETGALELLGYIDTRQATAARIAEVGAELVLVDEGADTEPAIALIAALKDLDESIGVIALTLDMQGEWLRRAFEAGANGAMSKAIHPAALATLAREAMQGNIVHPRPRLRPLDSANDHASLTGRELEILRLVASGATNGDIARQLWITQQTVKFHVSNVYRKLGVANRTEACHYAHLNGLVAAREPAWEPREPVAVAS